MDSKRVRTYIDAEFRAGAVEGTGTIRNLSEGGLFVGTRSLPTLGETVLVQFTPPGWRELEVSGMVWWTTRDAEAAARRAPGFGLRILEENPSYQEYVERQLD